MYIGYLNRTMDPNSSWDIELDYADNLSTPVVAGNETSSYLNVPVWEAAVTISVLTFIILGTILGNILVILSVFTYRPLRIVQNFFIVSLAVADLTVAILVLPFNVAYIVMGKWIFGAAMCEMWLTCDVMCCTASILNLCAIALDRYWAITDPINYAQKRTLRRVVTLIAVIWLTSGVICLPPLIGWNDWPDDFDETTPCELTKERGYIIYSSLGSFYIPLIIMSIVYLKIFIATKRRLRQRANASKLNYAKATLASVNAGNTSKEKPDQTQTEETAFCERNNSVQCKSLAPKKSGRGRKKRKRRSKHRHGVSRRNSSGTDVSEAGSMADEMSSIGLPETRKNSLPTHHGHGHHTVYQFIEQKQKISLSKERRAARTLGIIMGSFVVCWLPFFLMYVILPFCESCTVPNDKVIQVIVWLGYINSTLNPLIYTIFNLDFRRAFAKLLNCS